MMIEIPLKLYNIRGLKTLRNFDIPEYPGVYFIWSDDELLYIGSSENLRRRIAEHTNKTLFKRMMIVCEEAKKVCFIVTSNIQEAKVIEDSLIDLIPTKWNKEPLYKKEWYDDYKFNRGKFSS